jgi:alkanesulfonate monooxygenase SsuD/methylene tetrahydromethanopterin reductase-like flavin-dependent oxidoreductase (luciferase family)
MVTTLDQITRGRVICSLGAGWFHDEYTAYDVPFIEDHDELCVK